MPEKSHHLVSADATRMACERRIVSKGLITCSYHSASGNTHISPMMTGPLHGIKAGAVMFRVKDGSIEVPEPTLAAKVLEFVEHPFTTSAAQAPNQSQKQPKMQWDAQQQPMNVMAMAHICPMNLTQSGCLPASILSQYAAVYHTRPIRYQHFLCAAAQSSAAEASS